jgi:hypothetical protein
MLAVLEVSLFVRAEDNIEPAGHALCQFPAALQGEKGQRSMIHR